MWTKRLSGLEPTPVPPHVFALDGGELLYGAFGREDGGIELRDFRTVELPSGTFHSGPLGGPLRDPEAFKELLGEFLDTASGSVEEASLLLPDGWLRVLFGELSELPAAGHARQEVLRWKLRRLVPFRVDELRIQGVEVSPLPHQEEPKRVLLGFAIELLLSQLEDAFAAHGIGLGVISNASLSLLAGLGEESGETRSLTGLALIQEDGYSLVFARQGQPVVYRYKGLYRDAPETGRPHLVTLDLRLTRSFLEEKLASMPLERVLVAAPPERAERWAEWLGECLGQAPEYLDAKHLPLAEDVGPAPWHQLAPMLGAACREVA